MLTTLFSLIISAYLFFNPLAEAIAMPEVLGGAMVVLAAVLLIFMTYTLVSAWAPLQRTEHDLTPRTMQVYSNDRHIRIVDLWLGLFLVISLFAAIDIIWIHAIDTAVLVIFWVIAFGVSLDLLHHLIKRIGSYLNPFTVIDRFTEEANVTIQRDQTVELCHWVDALAESATKAVQQSSVSLGNHALNQMAQVAGDFLHSSKSIGHCPGKEQNGPLSDVDKVGYMMYYMLERIEQIHKEALHQGLGPMCGHILNTLGKIAIDSAKYDLTTACHPLGHIGKLAFLAQEMEAPDMGERAICTLLETGRAILREVDLSYGILKDPFFTLIAQLDLIAKEMFRQDKSINLKLLTQPFEDLKELFKQEKVAAHQDTPAITQDIDRVLAEFATLDQVLRAMPPLQKKEAEEE